MKIEEPHLQTLSKHKHIYDLFVSSGTVVGFTHDIQTEVLNAYRVHDPHYHYNHNCPACVAEMISIIYRWYLKQINE